MKKRVEVEVEVQYCGWIGYDGTPAAVFSVAIGGKNESPISLPCLKEPTTMEGVRSLEEKVMGKVIECLNKPTS